MWLSNLWKCYFLFSYAIVVRGTVPSFDRDTDEKMLFLPKYTPVGTVIYRFKASDGDGDYPLTFRYTHNLSYELLELKSIKPQEADAILIRDLEEVNHMYPLKIFVRDTTGDEGSLDFRINVTNANRYPDGVFYVNDASMQFTVSEAALPGTVIGKIRARSNPGSSGRVSLVSEDPNFKVETGFLRDNDVEGNITLVTKLDYEQQNVYEIKIAAWNGYRERGVDTRNIVKLSVVIVVKDEEDFPPVFKTLPSIVKLSIDSKMGDKIFEVQAEDGDSTFNRTIRYSIQSGRGSQYFQINSNTGEVVLSQNVIDMNESDTEPIVLHITADEGGQSSPLTSTTKDVLVLIEAIASEAPIFAQQSYEGEVDEHSAASSVVAIEGVTRISTVSRGKADIFTLNLEDENEGEMIERILEVEPPVMVRDGKFQIHVKNSEMLDYERFKTLKFKIVAKDVLDPSKLSSATVTIHLKDINDNGPKFTKDLYYAEVRENIREGEYVTQISATDEDEGFGEMTYSRIIGDHADKFNLDPKTGVITMATSEHGLDREKQTDYDFGIEVSDSGQPPRTNTTTLHIKILDVNDNPPKFREDLYEVVLAPDVPFTGPILRVEAIDADDPGSNNSVVHYEILEGNLGNWFELDRNTGELRLKKLPTSPQENERVLLNAEDIQEGYTYILRIRAYDMGIPQQYSNVNVHVYFKNNPAFMNVTVRYIYPGTFTSVNQEREQIARLLTHLNGAKTIIKNVEPYEDDNAFLPQARSVSDRSLIIASVRYPKETLVDLSSIAKELNVTAMEDRSVSTNKETASNPQHANNFPQTTQDSSSSEGQEIEKESIVIAGTDSQTENGWKIALITLLIILIIVILMLICYCCYRQSRRLDERNKVHPADEKFDKSSQVIEVATLEKGLGGGNNAGQLSRNDEKIGVSISQKGKLSSFETDEATVINGESKRSQRTTDAHDHHQTSAAVPPSNQQTHVSYSRHLHGMDSQNSRDAAGNGGRLGIHDDLQAEDAMEEIDDDFVDPLHTRVAHHSKAAPSKPKRQSDRLATEYNDDFDDDIEEIIVIEPDRGPSRANRRIRRIYKRGPARQIHPFPREEQVDDHDWGPMSLPEWLGKMPTSEYVDEYEGDANRHRPRKESVRKIGVETDSTNRRVIIRKYKGGGSLPGDRLVNESHVKGWREFADEDEELEQADRVEYSRRTIRERPRHRYRERGRALTRASFRLPEDSEDDLIDFDRVLEESSDHDTTNNNGINKNRNRGNNSVTHRDTLKGMSHNLSNITKADVGVGSGAIDGGEADVEDEVEKDGEVPREKRLKNLKHQKGVEVGDEMTDLLTFEAPVKHSIASSQTIETDNKFTQTQSNIPSANSDLVEDQDNKGTADATSGEFEFAFNSDHSPKDSSGSGGGESNATPRAGDSVQTETKPALPEKVKHDKKEKLPSKSNKSMKPKSESRYMDWYNKNGEKGLTKHKAHCEMTHHHHMNSHLQQESLLSQSSNDGENIADETKVPRRRDSDPLANDRHQRRIMATNTRTPGDKKRNDTVLDAMENEIRLGGNPFVAEDDEDSGIGQTDSFKSSKKQFLEKQSLFTIAYNGMQNKQDALKDREPSAPAHRVS